MITDQKTGRPIFYNRFNGAIPDVSTVTSTFETLLHLGTRSFMAVMDRGYYSKEKAGAFTKKLQKRRNEIIQMIKEGLTLDTNNKSFADVYLCQNEDGSIGLNNQTFQEANKHAGVFVLVSDCVTDGKQAYYVYRDRRTVEECFSDLKVKMCCDRFRVSSEDSLVGKCFVEFIALSANST